MFDNITTWGADMRRGSIEIFRDILAIGRCSTNEAIYRVGLNPPQMCRYRELLLEHGLIRPVPTGNGRRTKVFEPTPLGHELKRRIDRVLELLPGNNSNSPSVPLPHESIPEASDDNRPRI